MYIIDENTEVQRGEAAHPRIDGWSLAELYFSGPLWDICGEVHLANEEDRNLRTRGRGCLRYVRDL